MERDNDLTALPLIDDPTVKDVFAEFCTGLNFVHGNLHMTFASVTADYSSPEAPSKRWCLSPNCYADNRGHRA